LLRRVQLALQFAVLLSEEVFRPVSAMEAHMVLAVRFYDGRQHLLGEDRRLSVVSEHDDRRIVLGVDRESVRQLNDGFLPFRDGVDAFDRPQEVTQRG
jgi:hypothetical protein